MTISFAAAAVFVLRGLRLGGFRITPYGLCAAVGLVLAMALARRAAQRVGMDPEAVWDAGLFAIVSCFVASRLLLVLFNPMAFVRYPLLLLSLPSLTLLGMVLAAGTVWLYVRRKRLSLLELLDVFAAPGALLAALLELGHLLDGSETGMPTSLPWGVQDPWTAAPLPVHPVAVYGIVASLLIALLLWRALTRVRPTAGRTGALGLMLGGGAAFGLNLLTQPTLVPLDLWLEPGQWMALLAMLAGALLWSFVPGPPVPQATLRNSLPCGLDEGSIHPTPLQTETR